MSTCLVKCLLCIFDINITPDQPSLLWDECCTVLPSRDKPGHRDHRPITLQRGVSS